MPRLFCLLRHPCLPAPLPRVHRPLAHRPLLHPRFQPQRTAQPPLPGQLRNLCTANTPPVLRAQSFPVEGRPAARKPVLRQHMPPRWILRRCLPYRLARRLPAGRLPSHNQQTQSPPADRLTARRRPAHPRPANRHPVHCQSRLLQPIRSSPMTACCMPPPASGPFQPRKHPPIARRPPPTVAAPTTPGSGSARVNTASCLRPQPRIPDGIPSPISLRPAQKTDVCCLRALSRAFTPSCVRARRRHSHTPSRGAPAILGSHLSPSHAKQSALRQRFQPLPARGSRKRRKPPRRVRRHTGIDDNNLLRLHASAVGSSSAFPSLPSPAKSHPHPPTASDTSRCSRPCKIPSCPSRRSSVQGRRARGTPANPPR